jgi:DNA-binding transcriptional LysR family regulator
VLAPAPLSSRTDAKAVRDVLQAAQWLLALPGLGLWQLIDRYFAEHDLAPPGVLVGTDASITLLTSLLRNSDLITMLHTHAGRDLVALPYETAFLESRIGLFRRRKPYLSPQYKSSARRCMMRCPPHENDMKPRARADASWT